MDSPAPRGNRVLAAAMQRARDGDTDAHDEFERDQSTARRLLDLSEREALAEDAPGEPGRPSKPAKGKNAAALRAALSDLRSSGERPPTDAAKTRLDLRREPSSFDAQQTQVDARASLPNTPTLDAEQTQVAVKLPAASSSSPAEVAMPRHELPPLPRDSGPDLAVSAAPVVPVSTDEIPMIDDSALESDVIDSAQVIAATGDLRDPARAAVRREAPAPASASASASAAATEEPGLSFEPLVVVEGDALGTGEILPQEPAPSTQEVDVEYDEPYAERASSGTMVVARHRVSQVTQLVEAPPERLRPRWVLWLVFAVFASAVSAIIVLIAFPGDSGNAGVAAGGTTRVGSAAGSTTPKAASVRLDSAARAADAKVAIKASVDAGAGSGAGADAATIDSATAAGTTADAAVASATPDATVDAARSRAVARRRRRRRLRRRRARRRVRRRRVRRVRRHRRTKPRPAATKTKPKTSRDIERTIDPFKE